MEQRTYVQLAAGHSHSLVCTDAVGRCFTWGAGKNGQIGNGRQRNEKFPTQVEDGKSNDGELDCISRKIIVQVAAGANFSAALASDGSVYTWGDDHSGRLGHGGPESEYLNEQDKKPRSTSEPMILYFFKTVS